MEENQTVPAMIPEGDFAAFLEGEKVETLLSPLGYAYCAEGQDADLRVKRLERLEVTARRRGATPAQMEDWRMLRDRELDVEWMLNRDSVRSKARWVALQGSPLQTIASVQPREAEYLAEPYLPRGMITILAGHAGQGKTTLALWLASQRLLFHYRKRRKHRAAPPPGSHGRPAGQGHGHAVRCPPADPDRPAAV